MTVADDLADLQASWKLSPPAHVTLARIARGLAGVRSDSRSDGATCPPLEQLGPVDEEYVRRHVAALNGAAS